MFYRWFVKFMTGIEMIPISKLGFGVYVQVNEWGDPEFYLAA